VDFSNEHAKCILTDVGRVSTAYLPNYSVDCVTLFLATVQVFMKSVKLEWCLGDIKKAKELLDESVKHYPNFAKVCVFH